MTSSEALNKKSHTDCSGKLGTILTESDRSTTGGKVSQMVLQLYPSEDIGLKEGGLLQRMWVGERHWQATWCPIPHCPGVD